MKNKKKEQEKSNDDAAKYFDETKYVTAIIGTENTSNAAENDKLSNLIDLLTLPENKDYKEETLLTLKKEKAGDLLIQAIKNSKGKQHRAVLVAACWESEINYSEHLPFFVELCMNTDYLVSLEAITVIENMEGPFNNELLKESIKKLKEHKNKLNNEQQVLFNDLVNHLQMKVNE